MTKGEKKVKRRNKNYSNQIKMVGLQSLRKILNQFRTNDISRRKRKKLNFYHFQLRESKYQHIAELHREFEEDKQKVAEMKSKQKFRPY